MYIDENGDAAGNYTILALKNDHRQDSNLSMAYGLYPIGTFGLPDSNQIPVSIFLVSLFFGYGLPHKNFYQIRLNRY